VRAVVLSNDPGEDEFVAAVRHGAAGYLGKDLDPRRLPVVLRAVLAGEVALPRRFGARLLDELRGRDHRRSILSRRAGRALTDREWEVLELLGAGAGTDEMARRTGISPVTVRRHLSSAMGKLGVRDRAEAVALLEGCSRD
jgi:DNA-binding NarL/FixJ family response regulator